MIVEQASDFLARLRQAWRQALSKRRAVNELAACPPGELRRIASDVGLTGGDLRQLSCSHIGSSELLLQRLQLLRIDPEFVRHVAPATFRDLARVCASCKASRRCRRDLARGDIQAGMDGYCLNGPTIDALWCAMGARFNSAGTGGQHALADDAPGRTTGDSHD